MVQFVFSVGSLVSGAAGVAVVAMWAVNVVVFRGWRCWWPRTLVGGAGVVSRWW